MKLFPDHGETVAGLHDAVVSGTKTCEQIAIDCLARIERDEPQIRAWVSVDAEGLLAQARTLDDERRTGRLRGPLHGVPVGIKDIVDVAGFTTGGGSPLLSRGPAAACDAPLVNRLRQAGAMIPGKTVTTRFACFDPPPTRNPWNVDHTPGGSSSGSAAAVAARMIPAAIGSQTGGSITRPAAFCGVAGCKPSFGTVPLERVLPVAGSLDHPGPIAGTVRDLAIILRVLQGRSSDRALLSESQAPRLARLRGFSDAVTDPAMRESLDHTLDDLQAAGAAVIDVSVPAAFDTLFSAHRLIMAAEAAAWHRQRFVDHRDDYGPCVASLIEEGFAASACDYLAARDFQLQMTTAMEELCGDFDALVTPAAPGPAPDRSTTGNPCMNSPWSFTGMPTVSFPIAVAPNGLPLAMQLAGRRGQDEALHMVAAWCERVVMARV